MRFGISPTGPNTAPVMRASHPHGLTEDRQSMKRGSEAKPLPAGPSRPVGNVVLKVESYDGDAVSENCHPGVISGTVMGGQLDGQRIDAWTRITPTNSMVPTVADLQDESKMVRTPPGGYLALENVRVEAGRYTAQWINKMGDPGVSLRAGIPMQVSPSIGADGNVRRFRSNGATIYNGFLMHMGSAEQTSDLGAMRRSLAEAMDGVGAAALAVVLNTDQGVSRRTLSALRGWNDGAPAAVDDAVQRFFAANPESRFRQVYEAGGAVDVIPMEAVKVGSKVAESMDLGLRSEVPLKSFQTGGLGARIDSVLRRMDSTDAARIEAAFLAQAHPNAKSAFAAVGWKGVWNCDVERFFGNMGITLPRVPRYGFAVSTAVLKPYGADPSAGSFLAKARTMSAAVPRNAVPTPSDPKAVSRFHATISRAVSNALEIIPGGPGPAVSRDAGIDNDAGRAKMTPSGPEAAGDKDGVFRELQDRVEPEVGGQLDF